jgi:imidazolonepropionase
VRAGEVLFTGIGELVSPDAAEASTTPVQLLRDAQLLVKDGRIEAVGPRGSLRPHGPADCIDLGGRAVIPGLVDSHTHTVFAGDRIDEMARRARGETYEQIAQAGGGIAASVEALKKTSGDELVRAAAVRVRRMLARGTTTCEVKSGYGLTPDLELKQLRAIRDLADEVPVSVVGTALAHIVPKTYHASRAAYVDLFCQEVVSVAATERLARYVDVFVEAGAFGPDEARRIAAAARDAGLRVKLHVDQLRDGDGARLAAEIGALSADHLEYTSAAGRAALAEAGVIATILPGCAVFLGKGPWPEGRALRDAGCEVAVATDFNPGSSHVSDLLLCATLAATRGGLTLEEALWGITRGGAKALGLDDRGRLTVGERADFVVLDHDDWRAAFYSPANPPIHAVAIGGTWAVPPPPRS